MADARTVETVERMELRTSTGSLIGWGALGLAAAAVAALVPELERGHRVFYGLVGLAMVGIGLIGALRRRPPSVTLDGAGLHDTRLREPLVPWSLLDLAYYQPSDRTIRLRFRPGGGHSTEPATGSSGTHALLNALLPTLRLLAAHEFRDGELCVPLRGLAFDPTALRRLLATYTRPYEKTPYAAEVGAGSRSGS